MKIATRAAVCLVLFLVGTAVDSKVVAAHRLRIMAFNVEMMSAPRERVSLERFRWETARKAHLERVASVIESLEPDIVNLEEVTSAEAVKCLVDVLHEKGLTDYQGYHVECNDTFTGFDVALVSRIAPDRIDGKSIRTIFSPFGDATWRESYSFQDERGAKVERDTSISRNAIYFITFHGHKLGFLGLHLKSVADETAANAQRTAEAEVARRIIRKEIIDRGYLPIVLGDLNDYDADVADRDETRSTMTNVLTQLKDYDPSADGPELANAAEKIVRQADRYTSLWDRNENGVVDPGDVQTMIDHVLLPKSFMPHLRRAWISHTTDLTTSDHLPVVVDLDLPEADTLKSAAAPAP